MPTAPAANSIPAWAPCTPSRKPRATWRAAAPVCSPPKCSNPIPTIGAGDPPPNGPPTAKPRRDCLVALAPQGALQTAPDISDGGLAVALAEPCSASVGAGLAPPALGATVKLNDG